MKKINITFSTLAIILMSFIASAQTSKFKISNRISVEGNGGWDYLIVDENSSRLFVSHSTVVQVIDLKQNKLINTITDTKGVHGIALANDLNKGFISNGKDTSVTIFDLKNLTIITKIKVGLNPDAILYDPFSKKVFVFNGKSKDATVIDAKTNLILKTIALEGKPEFSVTDEKGKVFVNIEDKNAISVINTNTLQVDQTWLIAPGDEPTGLAIDNKTHRLFSVCGNKIMVVVNAENGKIITTLPIGDHCDGVCFDTELKNIYTSNGEGSITVIKEENENSFKILETIITQKGTKTITLDSKTHHIYTPTAEYEPIPEPTEENPKPKAKIKQGTFVILDLEPLK